MSQERKSLTRLEAGFDDAWVEVVATRLIRPTPSEGVEQARSASLGTWPGTAPSSTLTLFRTTSPTFTMSLIVTELRTMVNAIIAILLLLNTKAGQKATGQKYTPD